MSSPIEPQAGGRRRLDHVLGEGFLDDLPQLPVEELRARRAEAEQEETDLSYARRLLHGRLDLLRAEQEQRRGDGGASGTRTTEELVATLARTLADPPGPSHGLGRHNLAEPSRVGEHRRAAEAAVADPSISDPGGLDDDALAAAVARLEALADAVGTQRTAVQQAADALVQEIGRRYREGLLTVDDVLETPTSG
ncbi:aerial mycelium formation protein [Aquipuribacter nitratireducens]|uniref:Aerial mycelium formation protein n=1 Tax=Aquipuribacter nitratireducens TaxID=650104 RepID=A0ABW0GMB7_9MICO